MFSGLKPLFYQCSLNQLYVGEGFRQRPNSIGVSFVADQKRVTLVGYRG